MIEQALEKLKQMAIAGVEPVELGIDPSNLERTAWYNPASGTIEFFDLVSPTRNHTVSTLASLAGTFLRYSPAFLPSVWCSLKGVTVVLDDELIDDDDETRDGVRRHMIKLPISASPIFETLRQMPNDQKRLVLALRHDLRPARIDPPNFLETISHLNFETQTSSQGDFGVLKSTLGSTKNSEVKAKNDIPPEITASFTPFPSLESEIDGTVSVDCSVVIDADSKQISVRPFPGEIEQASATAVEMLRQRVIDLLEVENTVVFSGTP